MVANTWPVDVNQNQEDGTLTEQPEDNIGEFKPEAGPALAYQLTSIASSQISYSTVMTAAEVDSITDFYATTLKNGVLPFTRKHPRTREADVTFKFAAPPKISGITRRKSRVTIQLIKLP